MTDTPKKPKKKLRRRLKHTVSRLLRLGPERWLVQLAYHVVPRLSRNGVMRLASAIGHFGFHCFSQYRKITLANLDVVFGPAADKAQREELAKRIFSNIMLIILDCFWFMRDTDARIKEYITWDPDVENHLFNTNESAIAITGHLGFWEMAAQLMCLHGRTVTSVFAPIGSDKTQEMMEKMRKSNGQNIVARRGAVLSLLRALRNGQLVGLLLDQQTPIRNGGVWVDFLGTKASMSNVAGVLSARCKVQVYVLWCRNTGNGHYRLEEVNHLPANHALSDQETTQWVADALGSVIRKYPEQWLWMYRRWRHVAPGEDPAKYPFYARPYNPGVD